MTSSESATKGTDRHVLAHLSETFSDVIAASYSVSLSRWRLLLPKPRHHEQIRWVQLISILATLASTARGDVR